VVAGKSAGSDGTAAPATFAPNGLASETSVAARAKPRVFKNVIRTSRTPLARSDSDA
jgi:hypothetical protein